MAQPIAAVDWVPGITDNRFLPGRTKDLVTGKGVNIANNKLACVTNDIVISDYITTPDHRRVNGLSGTNPGGNDGIGASEFGVFQDVRITTRFYSMTRERSMALRVWDVPQYDGPIGYFGDAQTSSVYHPGQNLSVIANLMQEAKKRWDAEILGPDIDRYNLAMLANGHMGGRWVDDNPDAIFNGEGHWVAVPGEWQGAAIPPSFAPITCIEFDNTNILKWLNNIETVWTNLYIPEDNRVIVIDKFYKYAFLTCLTGESVGVTEKGFDQLESGLFDKRWGWTFRFDIPSQYYPHVWVDDNLNVVHDATGTAPYDAYINGPTAAQLAGLPDGLKLQTVLAEANRTRQTNMIRRVYNKATGEFEQRIFNYPLGQPGAVPYLGAGQQVGSTELGTAESETAIGAHGQWGWDDAQSAASKTIPPFTPQPNFPGIGLGSAASGPIGTPTRRKVIGFVLYTPAGQFSQEYSELWTASGLEGVLRGRFHELATVVKWDAWVIEQYSHGIMPILDVNENVGTPGIPVVIVGDNTSTAPPAAPTYDDIVAYATPNPVKNNGGTTQVTARVIGTGAFDTGVTYAITGGSVTTATISADGLVTATDASTGDIEVTVTSIGSSSLTKVVTITVEA